MAWTKRYLHPGDYEEGYYFDIGTFVCEDHFNDYFLINHIQKEGKSGFCSYCEENRIVTELESVLEVIAGGLGFIYEDPAESRYLNKDSEYGYDGNVMPFHEMWWGDPLNLQIEDSQLWDDITNQLETDQLYCERDEFVSHKEILDDLWNHFKMILKHRARFAFHFTDTFKNWHSLDPADILHQVQKAILSKEMISVLPKDSELYRTRQHQNKDQISAASHIASLPNLLNKTAGRMNAAGISLFYCSQDKSLSIKEVVNKRRKSNPFFTTVAFRTNENLRLVDFTKTPRLPSIFDIKNNDSRDIIFFMETFMTEISQPVESKNSILEYLPTQVVTEYLRYNPELNVQGMIYWSAKEPTKKNIVLFYDHDDSLENLQFIESSLRTSPIKDL